MDRKRGRKALFTHFECGKIRREFRVSGETPYQFARRKADEVQVSVSTIYKIITGSYVPSGAMSSRDFLRTLDKAEASIARIQRLARRDDAVSQASARNAWSTFQREVRGDRAG